MTQETLAKTSADKMTAEAMAAAHIMGTVDNLFRTRAEIKRLTELETGYKEELERHGGALINGSFVQAVLKTVTPAASTDYKALMAFLKVSTAVLKRFAKAKASYVTITLKPLEH